MDDFLQHQRDSPNGVDPLMLQKVAQHPGNVWLCLLQLFLSGRPIFLIPIEASASSISALAVK